MELLDSYTEMINLCRDIKDDANASRLSEILNNETFVYEINQAP